MADTPDVRPVGDLPNGIGRTAARQLVSRWPPELSTAVVRTSSLLDASSLSTCRLSCRRGGDGP